MVRKVIVVDVQERKRLEDPGGERDREELEDRPQSGMNCSELSARECIMSKQKGTVSTAVGTKVAIA